MVGWGWTERAALAAELESAAGRAAELGQQRGQLAWALALCAVGIPVYWWYAVQRRPALAT